MNSFKILKLPKIFDNRGNLTFIEANNHVPFLIKRTYLIYDVPSGEKRGGHAFKSQKELIICLSGSFDVIIDDSINKNKIRLNKPDEGLYIENGIWRQLTSFSTNSIALLISNTKYNGNDYVRNYDEYLKLYS